MTREEAKQYIKVGKLIFNKKTNKIVKLSSQWSDDFDYADDEKTLWADNYNEFNVFPDGGAIIKVGELEDWEPVNNEKLNGHSTAYCNFLHYRFLQLEQRLGNARIDF